MMISTHPGRAQAVGSSWDRPAGPTSPAFESFLDFDELFVEQVARNNSLNNNNNNKSTRCSKKQQLLGKKFLSRLKVFATSEPNTGSVKYDINLTLPKIRDRLVPYHEQDLPSTAAIRKSRSSGQLEHLIDRTSSSRMRKSLSNHVITEQPEPNTTFKRTISRKRILDSLFEEPASCDAPADWDSSSGGLVMRVVPPTTVDITPVHSRARKNGTVVLSRGDIVKGLLDEDEKKSEKEGEGICLDVIEDSEDTEKFFQDKTDSRSGIACDGAPSSGSGVAIVVFDLDDGGESGKRENTAKSPRDIRLSRH